jgi:hypothetical protein
MTDRQKAAEILENLRNAGFEDSKILDHIVFDFLSGTEALNALLSVEEEIFGDEEEEEE